MQHSVDTLTPQMVRETIDSIPPDWRNLIVDEHGACWVTRRGMLRVFLRHIVLPDYSRSESLALDELVARLEAQG